MNSEQRLGQLVDALGDAGLEFVIMGGHAVRYYGVTRNTVDFDFCANLATSDQLRQRVRQLPMLSGCVEGPSWRPKDFVRFQIGRLPDGREEWLEFWLRNHLLPPFEKLRDRQEIGRYGERDIPFIGLNDLLRSKETEREGDWQDITLLEEIQDSRHLTECRNDVGIIKFMTNVRSRRGFERGRDTGLFERGDLVEAALRRCDHAVTFAWLHPVFPQIPPGAGIEAKGMPPVATEEFGGSRHLAVVEIVRRAYRRKAMEADRADKQRQLKHP